MNKDKKSRTIEFPIEKNLINFQVLYKFSLQSSIQLTLKLSDYFLSLEKPFSIIGSLQFAFQMLFLKKLQ